MNLGSSIRRRRGGSGGKRKGRGSGGPGPWQALRVGAGQWLLIALGVLLVGSSGGYLYATQMVFPRAELAEQIFHPVPDLRNMTVEEAERALAPLDLALGEVDSIRHPEVPSGLILGQTPLPTQLGTPGRAVDVTLSLGPERRPVPDVSRLQADRAVTVLQTTGFEVEVDSIEAPVPEGRVVETDPPAGEEVTLPSDIRLTVSLGPPLVELPDLVGMQEEQALQVLDSLGLEVGEVDTAFRFGFSQGEVLEQRPEAGEEIPEGSRVHLVVGRRGFFRDSSSSSTPY